MSSTFRTVAVILACLSSACHSFTYLHQPVQQSANRINSRLAAAQEHNEIDVGFIKKRFTRSIVSFGLALSALSLPSLAVELPLTYISDDKSITFQHTTDLQFSPKPLKTHDKEILFKSETIKGFNAGVTVRGFMLLNIKCHSFFHLFILHPDQILRNHIHWHAIAFRISRRIDLCVKSLRRKWGSLLFLLLLNGRSIMCS